MRRIPVLATAVAAAFALLTLSGAAFAHGEAGEMAAEFDQHMGIFAGDIQALIASVDGIVAGYQPDGRYAGQLDALVEQWESVAFHEAVETNAMALYPPIWAAIGGFSKAVKEGAPIDAVRARGDAIGAALWQGYGALKLLAARKAQGSAQEHAQAPAAASGEAAIDEIHEQLERVLALYQDGKNDAALDLIHDTYMGYFEGIEGDLIEQDAKLVSGLEADFNASLPTLIKNNAAAQKVAEQIEAMQADLNQARELIESAEKHESSVF
ncbi:MAG: hypothetical protein L0H83_08800 [Salinisphaera sp.]|nr:hypothetical protein [Salinisphaera sp.]